MICYVTNTLKRIVKLVRTVITVCFLLAGVLWMIERYVPMHGLEPDAEATVQSDPLNLAQATNTDESKLTELDLLVRDVASDERCQMPELILRAIVRHESVDELSAVKFEEHKFNAGMRFAKENFPPHLWDGMARIYASSFGYGQVMGFHALTAGVSWVELTRPAESLFWSCKVYSDCYNHKNIKTIKNEKKRIDAALGCYNGDKVNYPPKVYAALGEILYERM